MDNAVIVDDMTQVDTPTPRRPKWSLGDRLAKARKEAGYSQARLAAILGLGLKTLQRYELDRTLPNKATQLGWSLACNVDPVWLVHGVDGDGPTGGGTVTQPVTLWERRRNQRGNQHLTCPPVKTLKIAS